MTIVKGRALSNEEELQAAVARIDIPQIYAYYKILERNKLYNRLKRLLSKKARSLDRNVTEQLSCLELTSELIRLEPVLEQPLIMLGALEYVQDRWEQFPNSGPLAILALKHNDLLEIVAENYPDIKLPALFNDPAKIQHQALARFKTFMENHSKLRHLIE